MNTGTKAVSLVLMGNELTAIISDARWLLIVILVCVVADFRYGWGINKLVDYFIWVCLGMLVGWAILRPLGIDYMLGGIVATIIAVACEAKSFIGHFIYLHGVNIKEKTITGFLKAFAVSFAKRKNKDIGEALEDGLKESEHESK